jgi:hypothetical protein
MFAHEGKPFSLFGCDKFIDIDGMNGLITRSIATTVAKRFPASGYTGQKEVSYYGYSSWNPDTDGCWRIRDPFPLILGDRRAPALACHLLSVP